MTVTANALSASLDSLDSLDSLLSPMTRQVFLQKHWGKTFTHVDGTTNKFSHLAPWNDVNRILEEHMLTSSHLQLHQGGTEIEPQEYLYRLDGVAPFIKVPEFMNLLARGASLVINEFDRLYRPVRELAVALEETFRTHIWANLYAGWRQDNAFHLHYDEHDTFIVQVSGRKKWTVYEPTRLHPLEHGKDVEPAKPPTKAPIWDGLLLAGSLLYVPRGWWHIVTPIDEPTLHLTIGLKNPRGLDLLHWFVQQLRTSVSVRNDIPQLGSPEEQAAYADELRNEMIAAWEGDIIGRYMADSDSKALPRPHISLPGAATPHGVTISPQTTVRLAGPRLLALPWRDEGGIIRFRCHGKDWQCDKFVLPALQKLNDGRAHTIDDLIRATVGKGTGFVLMTLMQALLLGGVIVEAPTGDSLQPIED